MPNSPAAGRRLTPRRPPRRDRGPRGVGPQHRLWRRPGSRAYASGVVCVQRRLRPVSFASGVACVRGRVRPGSRASGVAWSRSLRPASFASKVACVGRSATALASLAYASGVLGVGVRRRAEARRRRRLLFRSREHRKARELSPRQGRNALRHKTCSPDFWGRVSKFGPPDLTGSVLSVDAGHT